jgi:heme ABC exporter ATP-binding subunit CcmA
MMGTNPAAVEAIGLSKTLGPRPALCGVTLTLAEGETVALTGPNGAGKTTLLRCLASVLRPSAGEVRWFGRPARSDPGLRRQVGLLGHESLLYPHLTLLENLRLAARMCGVRDAAAAAYRWLRTIGLESFAGRLPSQISRGMRQRVALARALIHRPRIVLLDEPFSALDADGAEWLAALLGDLRAEGRSVCFATHDPERARTLADRVIQLRSGRLFDVRDGASPGRAPARAA